MFKEINGVKMTPVTFNIEIDIQNFLSARIRHDRNYIEAIVHRQMANDIQLIRELVENCEMNQFQNHMKDTVTQQFRFHIVSPKTIAEYEKHKASIFDGSVVIDRTGIAKFGY